MNIQTCAAVGVFSTLLVFAACGSESKSDPDASIAVDAGAQVDAGGVQRVLCQSQAGSRLTRQVIEPTPGARQELGIVDTELDLPCVYERELDLSSTCYPSDTGGLLLFQDAQCSAAIVGFGVGATPNRFNRRNVLSLDGCSTTPELRSVGVASPVAGGQNVFRLDGDGVCVGQLAPTRDYYLASAVLPTTAFVTAETQLVSDLPRLSAETLVGTDGSSMCASTSAAIDSSLATACQLRLAADQETRCLPTASSLVSFFTDAACANAVDGIFIGRCEAGPPAYGFENESLACGASARHLRALSSAPAVARFDLQAQLCVAEPDLERMYFTLADEAPATDFAGLTAEIESGSGRLQRQLLTTEDGFAAFAGSWFDTSLAVPCTFQKAADGSQRCLPRTMTLSSFFSDSACTAPISLAFVDECQAPPGFFAANAAQGKRMLAAVPHTDPVFALEATVCNPLAGSFFKPAFEVAPSSFELGEPRALVAGE